MKIVESKQLKRITEEYKKESAKHRRVVRICCDTGCLARGAEKIVEAFREYLKRHKVAGFTVEAIKQTGCQGFCEQGPLVVIEPGGTVYTGVRAGDVEEIMAKSIAGEEVVERLLFTNRDDGSRIAGYPDIPFYARQHQVALRNVGRIVPLDIREYIAEGGFRALARALETMTPDEVIDEIAQSELRGRGGGGFPAGKKWRTCRNAPSDTRYVICNGDEGDPGAFMDRSIMEGDPYAVLEGMMICAYAVGAKEGYIYVREEYPLAVVHLQKAIAVCEEYGLLGERIFGTGFSFSIRIARGAGAFVCGESSALMRSVAGDVGEPRAKYIHSVLKGLYDRPTVLNNVETFVNVPVIIRNGAGWFKKTGTEKNRGTKVFSLVGKVRNTGLIEVALGTTLREIIYGIGGGIIDGRKFKGVQTGGPSGGCLPEALLDLPVDFDSLTAAGSMMGSGGMIVMDDKTCMVDLARYFLNFLVSESCGKCVPCREGLYQLHKLTEKICAGEGAEEDMEKMEKLSRQIEAGSLCGLGKSGPKPLLSTLRYYRDEYLAHIRDKKCPAGVCKNLITYRVDSAACTGCLACVAVCPFGAITGRKKEPQAIDGGVCRKCGACITACKYDAIETV